MLVRGRVLGADMGWRARVAGAHHGRPAPRTLRVRRIDFIRYAWSALMANQFGETDPVFTADGQTVLTYYSIDGDNGWQYFALLFAFFGVFTLLVSVAARRGAHSLWQGQRLRASATGGRASD